MARLSRAHHFGITVADVDRSVGFYRDLLGFEEVFRWNPRAEYIGTLVGHPEVDLTGVVLRLPDDSVSIELLHYGNVESTAIDTDNANSGTAHVAFYVDDLDELWETLSREGIRALSAPVTPSIGPNRGGRAIYLVDPDGVRVELIQSARSFAEFAADAELVDGC